MGSREVSIRTEREVNLQTWRSLQVCLGNFQPYRTLVLAWGIEARARPRDHLCVVMNPNEFW